MISNESRVTNNHLQITNQRTMSKKKNPKVGKKKSGASSKVKSAASKKNRFLPSTFYDVKVNCILIFLLSFIFYGMTLAYDYTQDDAIVIKDNMFTTEGVAGIKGILTNDTFYGFFQKDGKAFLVDGGRYRPLTLVMFAMEWQLFGDSPFAFHFITVLLYAFTGIVLYLLLLQMLRPSKGENYAFFVALITTLLFIAHPIHVEVVANIKGRDEIVALLGSLAALYFSLRGYYEDSKYNFFAAGIFLLALLAKENAITFCAIVPLTYFVFTKADFGKIITQTIPFLAMAVLFVAIRTSVIGFDFGAGCTELMNCPYLKIENGRYVDYTFNEKFGTIFYTLGQYVKLLFFPHPLTHDYYPYHIETMSFANWKALLSLVMYIGLGVYALIGIMKKDVVAYGIAFYITTLSIVSNIVFPVGTNMAERFVFMPSAGFCLVIAVLLYRLIQSKGKAKAASNMMLPLGIVGVVLVLFFAKTFSRNQAWKDNYTLFTTDVEVSKNSAKLRNSAGGTTLERAMKLPEGSAEQTALLSEAVGHLNEAIKIHPNYKNAYLLLGNAHQLLYQFDKSFQYYDQALRLDPGYADAENNLTFAYQNAGKYFGEKLGNAQKSIQYLQTALQRDPNNFETLRLLGVAYGMSKNNGKAIEYLEKALQLQPENPSIMFNLGIAIYQSGDQARGNQLIEKAKQLDPTIGN